MMWLFEHHEDMHFMRAITLLLLFIFLGCTSYRVKNKDRADLKRIGVFFYQKDALPILYSGIGRNQVRSWTWTGGRDRLEETLVEQLRKNGFEAARLKLDLTHVDGEYQKDRKTVLKRAISYPYKRLEEYASEVGLQQDFSHIMILTALEVDDVVMDSTSALGYSCLLGRSSEEFHPYVSLQGVIKQLQGARTIARMGLPYGDFRRWSVDSRRCQEFRDKELKNYSLDLGEEMNRNLAAIATTILERFGL